MKLSSGLYDDKIRKTKLGSKIYVQDAGNKDKELLRIYAGAYLTAGATSYYDSTINSV